MHAKGFCINDHGYCQGKQHLPWYQIETDEGFTWQPLVLIICRLTRELKFRAYTRHVKFIPCFECDFQPIHIVRKWDNFQTTTIRTIPLLGLILEWCLCKGHIMWQMYEDEQLSEIPFWKQCNLAVSNLEKKNRQLCLVDSVSQDSQYEPTLFSMLKYSLH